jgi:hypothetical protein
MMPPRATSLRLWTRTAGARPPQPPLGLAAWNDQASALAVLLDVTGLDVDDPRTIADQVPHATELPPTTPVFVFAAARSKTSLLRWLAMRTTLVSRATRCTVLVARGYVGVGAGVDAASGADLAWGVSSPC